MLILSSNHPKNYMLSYKWLGFYLGNVGGDPTQRSGCLALATPMYSLIPIGSVYAWQNLSDLQFQTQSVTWCSQKNKNESQLTSI